MSGGNTTPRGTGAECRKFAPNIFNKSKCSSCFKQKEEHSAEALECNRATRKISKCGYLFVAPGWDFSNPLNRTKDEDTNNLELHSWMHLDWIDDRLKWDHTLFDNNTHMPVPYWKIWTPEITHNGAGSSDNEGGFFNIIHCIVRSTGRVRCTIETVSNIKCDTDFTYWPYDRHNCTLILGSWLLGGDELVLKRNFYYPVAYGMFDAEAEWALYVGQIARDEIQSMYFKNSTTEVVTVYFILDRTSNCLSGQVISKAIIMMVLTIVTAYLAPLSVDRFAIAYLNIVVHMLGIMNLNWTIPHNGETVPNILLFYCNSLVMATIALLLTFVLGNIETKKTNPPKWVTSCIVRILRNKFGQILLLSIFEIGDPRPAADVEATADDTDALVNSDAKSKNLVWRYVSTLFLGISYYAFILTYFIMFIVLVIKTMIVHPPTTVDLNLYMF